MEYRNVNKILKKYENIHAGETAVLVGGGPSIDKFKPIENALYAGVNWVGKDKLFDQSFDDFIAIDYYFFCDRDRHMSPDFKVKRQKFCASLLWDGEAFREWEEAHVTYEESKKFNSIILGCSDRFHRDISQNPIMGGTISMAALQFLLYVGVSKIYLVGQDCSGSTAFGESRNNLMGAGWGEHSNNYQGPAVQQCWDHAKEFIDKEYPDVEMISVNPVKLKGYFKDEYTE